ncbi:MAG: DUF1674 domain-containing protein [Telmatospirillum sp.]|nr:DUF1674 domain-containing protein [Telmatospirillum sp.]
MICTEKTENKGGSGAGTASESDPEPQSRPAGSRPLPAEYGGPKGPEPTRYNDWEKGGRCVDF